MSFDIAVIAAALSHKLTVRTGFALFNEPMPISVAKCYAVEALPPFPAMYTVRLFFRNRPIATAKFKTSACGIWVRIFSPATKYSEIAELNNCSKFYPFIDRFHFQFGGPCMDKNRLPCV